MTTTVQGLWVGSELSDMEALSISSFLRHGHAYHLYVYSDVSQIPTGTTLKDGNEILPESMIFQYQDHKTYAGFANFFRYKLLLDKGGWWVDTDMICLQPFDFTEEYVFASEWAKDHVHVTSGIIKTPAGSPVMQYAWQVCQAKSPEQLYWGEVGPHLVAEAVEMFGLERYVKPYDVFCPLAYPEWDNVLSTDITWNLGATTHAIHLWNEMWRRKGYDKNRRYHPDCLYEQLRRRYLES